jgi:hypothetical protein
VSTASLGIAGLPEEERRRDDPDLVISHPLLYALNLPLATARIAVLASRKDLTSKNPTSVSPRNSAAI